MDDDHIETVVMTPRLERNHKGKTLVEPLPLQKFATRSHSMLNLVCDTLQVLHMKESSENFDFKRKLILRRHVFCQPSDSSPVRISSLTIMICAIERNWRSQYTHLVQVQNAQNHLRECTHWISDILLLPLGHQVPIYPHPILFSGLGANSSARVMHCKSQENNFMMVVNLASQQNKFF